MVMGEVTRQRKAISHLGSVLLGGRAAVNRGYQKDSTEERESV